MKFKKDTYVKLKDGRYAVIKGTKNEQGRSHLRLPTKKDYYIGIINIGLTDNIHSLFINKSIEVNEDKILEKISIKNFERILNES